MQNCQKNTQQDVVIAVCVNADDCIYSHEKKPAGIRRNKHKIYSTLVDHWHSEVHGRVELRNATTRASLDLLTMETADADVFQSNYSEFFIPKFRFIFTRFSSRLNVSVFFGWYIRHNSGDIAIPKFLLNMYAIEQ